MRIVRVSTATVSRCSACGSDHRSVALYDCVGGPGIAVAEGMTKAIVCPNQDYTVVLVDATHIESTIPVEEA